LSGAEIFGLGWVLGMGVASQHCYNYPCTCTDIWEVRVREGESVAG
jgi:hypothetical protein